MSCRFSIGSALLLALSWQCETLCAATPTGAVRDIACAPTNAAVAAAVLNHTIWITTDDGNSWNQVAKLPFEPPRDAGEESEPWGSTDETENEISFRSQVNAGKENEQLPLPNLLGQPRRTDGVSSGRSGPQAVRLAVGDDGCWAAARGSYLYSGRVGQAGYRRMSLSDSNGVHIDAAGNLWATTQSALLLLGSADGRDRTLRRWSLTNPRAPQPGNDPDEIAVPVLGGIWHIKIAPTGGEMKLRFRPVTGLVAVSRDPNRSDWWVVRNNRLTRQSRDNRQRDVIGTPRGVTRLRVGRQDEVSIYAEDTGWWHLSSGRWQKTTQTAVAVDAAGRFWLGTVTGVLPPRGRPSQGNSPARAPTIEPNRVPIIFQTPRLTDPPPPPCRRFRFNPLPDIRLELRLGHLARRHRTLPIAKPRASINTSLFAGLTATWRFSPVETASCAIRRNQWHTAQLRKVHQTRAMWRRLAEFAGQPIDEGTLNEAIHRRLKREQTVRLLTIISGQLPAGSQHD